jgi:hypothetical protein
LSGLIGYVAPDFSEMTLQTGTGDRCVTITAATSVFETELEADNSISFEQKSASDLEAGQTADAFGDNGPDGCLHADTIIFEDDDVQVQPVP